jgi:hypothetical protein
MFGIMTKARKLLKRFNERQYSFYCPARATRKRVLAVAGFFREEAPSHGYPYSVEKAGDRPTLPRESA